MHNLSMALKNLKNNFSFYALYLLSVSFVITIFFAFTSFSMNAVMLEKIVSDNPLENGDEVSVLVNGLGATPLEEQMIFYRAVHKLLDNRGVSVVLPHIGEYATSMEMAGLSLTVFKLDDQLKRLLKAPASTPFYNFS